MSDEEKKAVDELKKEINNPVEVPTDKFNTFILYNIESARTILNLIEKQSKEIEELTLDLEEMTKSNNHKKENWVHKSILNSYISKDKIKVKIEELEKQKRQWIEDRDNKHKDSEIIYAIEVLQSLLEKE